MRPQIALAATVTFALALCSLGCGHTADNDGMLREYRPLAGQEEPERAPHVSASRLPASGNAQTREPQADPSDPWGSGVATAEPQPIAAQPAAAPVNLDAEASAPVDLDAEASAPPAYSDEPVMDDIAAGLAAGEPEPEPEPVVEETYEEESYEEAHVDEPSSTGDVAPARLTVRIKGKRNRCKVSVCGKPLGRAPFSDRAVTSGRHTVTIKCPKKRSFEQMLDLEPGRSSSLMLSPADLKKKGKARKQKRRRRRL